MLDNKSALLFDFDGTLVDSMGVWVQIDEDYIKKYNLVEPEHFHKDMEGLSYTETAEYFLKVFPTLPHTVEELKEEWYHMALYKYTHEIELKKGAEAFLRKAKEDGFKTGIATSNDRQLVEACLASLGISECIDTISTGCEVQKGKPAPDVYLKAAENLHIKPESCLVFEDVPMGILAGKNAGMEVCAVEDWFSAKQREKKRALADYYIQDYTGILNHIFEVL